MRLDYGNFRDCWLSKKSTFFQKPLDGQLQKRYKNTAQSLFIKFKKGYSIYCWSAKWYEQNWEENFPTILGLERRALKLVRNLIGLLFVKNQSGC